MTPLAISSTVAKPLLLQMKRRLAEQSRIGAILAALWVTPGVGYTLPTVHGVSALGDCKRISVDNAGNQVAQWSYWPRLTPDGAFLVFTSYAQLVPQDTNTANDVYLCDFAVSSGPQLISVTTTGLAAPQGALFDTGVSADGRFVAFLSYEDNLVVGETGADLDAFVRDRLSGTTVLVSQSSTGTHGSAYRLALSSNGRFVVFSSLSNVLVPMDTNGLPDVFVRDLVSGLTERISVGTGNTQGNGAAMPLYTVAISADGRYACFTSEASNLVAGDTNGRSDVFVRDRTLGNTLRVSTDSSGQQANDHSYDPTMSLDGRMVTFTSVASNLTPADTNSVRDVFVHDLNSRVTQRVSLDSSGFEANDVSQNSYLSPDGRFVSFATRASNLAEFDTDQDWDSLIHDRLTKRTFRVDTNLDGKEPNDGNGIVSFSADARTLAFNSAASDLIAGDTNSAADVFIRSWQPPGVYCTAKTNSLGCVSAIDMSGTASASSTSGFAVIARDIINQKAGLLIYSTSGFAHVPFHGGTLCVLEPIQRTPPQTSAGSTTGADCTGTFAFDFNAWIATSVDGSLIAGARVWAQYWSRDPGFPPPHSVNLTNALTFEIAP